MAAEGSGASGARNGSAAGRSDESPQKEDRWWEKRLDELEEPDDEELDIEHRTFPQAPQPDDMVTPLLPFQLEFLHWACRQEHSDARGGILADEMGMGKTLQAIALILANRTDTIVADASCCGSEGGHRHAPAYESEGAAKERQDWEKAALKDALKGVKASEKEAAKAARAAEAEAKRKAAAEQRALQREFAKVARQLEREDAKAAKKSAAKAAAKAPAKGENGAEAAAAAAAGSPAAGGAVSAMTTAAVGAAGAASAAAPTGSSAGSAVPAAALVPSAASPVHLLASSTPVTADSKAGASGATEATASDASGPTASADSALAPVAPAAAEEPAAAGAAAAADAATGTASGSGKGKGKAAPKKKAGPSASEVAAMEAAAASLPPFLSSWKPLCGVESTLDTLATGSPQAKSTLVICPVVALTQWRSELLRHTKPGSLSVIIYHGANRATTAEDLAHYDVVLTTYSVVQSEYSKMVEPSKVTCEWCGKPFLPDKLRVHLRYFCGPDAQRTSAQAKQERKHNRGRAAFAARMMQRSGAAAGGAGGDDDDDDGDGSSAPSSGGEDGEDSPSDDGDGGGRVPRAGGGARRARSSPAAARPSGRKGAIATAAGDSDAGDTPLETAEVISIGDSSDADGVVMVSKKPAPSGKSGKGGGGVATADAEGGDDDDPFGRTWRGANASADATASTTEAAVKAPAVPAPAKKRSLTKPGASGAGVGQKRGRAASAGAGRGAGAGKRAASAGSGTAGAGGKRAGSKGSASAAKGKTAAAGGGATGRRGSGGGKKGATGSASKRPRRGDSDGEPSSDDSEDSDFSLSSSSSSSSSSASDLDSEDSDGSLTSSSEGVAPRRATSTRRSPGAGAGAGASSSSSSSAGAAGPRSANLKLGPVSVLQKVHWRRIICDEAHALKNKRCATAKAVFCLTAERRWCLSGTPLQNRVGEIFSLLRFLRYAPYALYYCKNCPCASLDYRFDEGGRHCELCGHSPLRHYNWLMRLVLNPIKMYGYSGPGRDAMVTLRKEVLDSVLLRRTKAGRSADLSLPGRLISVRNDLEMDAFEEDFYSALYTQTQAKFGGYVAAGTVLSNYAHIFDLLTRLRQAVNHPYLILYGNGASAGDADGAGAALTDVCGICREAVEDPVVTGCRHVFCRLCMREYLETLGGTALSMLRDLTHDEAADGVDGSGAGAAGEDRGADEGDDGDDEGELDGGAGAGAGKAKAKGTKKPGKPAAPKKRPASASKAKGKGKGAGAGAGAAGAGVGAGVGEEGGAVATCPTCFCELTVDLAAAPSAVTPAIASAAKRKSILARLPPDRVGASFRSSTKIEALLEDLWAAQAEEPGLKAIVFSQFVNMLDLIQHRLTHAGVRCVKMDGGMSVPARDRVINAFRDDPHVTVFLISLKAGGVALNLTAASRIYLMDCWWNWASENQAMDRTHRLGQHRSISVVRFFVRNTIEERILALQERKKLVFDATVGQDNAATSKLTAEDMRFLFSR